MFQRIQFVNSAELLRGFVGDFAVMELCLSSQDYHSKKILFNLKTHRSDGLILQIHHSYSDSLGENKRYRFIHASFNGRGSHLAVSDHKGHVFIINLEMERYWQLPQVGLPTLISFPVLRNQELLVGLDNTSVLFIHIETGNVTGVLQGHSVPVAEVSYSDDGYYYLTSCSAEAIVWDSSTYTQIHRLSLKLEVSLKKVLFMPVSNNILACFQDDTMHIWKFKSFECIKQIVPETWKTHHLKAIAITKNGRAMVIGGHSTNLVIFCLDTWVIKNVVEFPENISGVKQMEFLSQVFDGGANKILVVLTVSQELVFFDMQTLVFLKWVYQINGVTAKFSLSSNGKYLASILTTGEINIYTIERILADKDFPRDLEEWCSFNQDLSNRYHSNSSRRTQRSYESLSSIQKEIRNTLSTKKLLPILKQFGEYPQSYRTLIWKTLLKLPENKESFVSLSLKKCHPSYSTLELKYPLANKALCNSLKKLLSSISHWCPLFGEVDFLPEFVFPFVKLFHSSPLVCFEVVATIIVNWCQNWFEFYPFPPINMLSVLESILGHYDPNLLKFYMINNVTSSVSICPLFHTAFSEVLSKSDWLKLWDHVLSNEPSFLFMAIIAYNVVCQSAIRNLQGVGEIEKFFHTQNPVDLKMVIHKAYHYLKETPENIHTRQFFSTFRCLGTQGTYISFLAYPKLIVDASVEKLQCLRQEQDEVLDEQFKALNMKKILERKLRHDTKFEDKKKIYRELEDKIRKIVEEEEDRVLIERRKLQNLRQDLKLKELEILETTRDKVLGEKIREKEKEFERLLEDISKRRLREEAGVDVVEKEISNYYSDLLLRKCQLEMELGINNIGGDAVGNLEVKDEKLKSDFSEYEWDNLRSTKRADLRDKITVIKGLICSVEVELAKEIMEKSCKLRSKDDAGFMEELKRKVNSLENEIENLIKENLNKLQNEIRRQKSVNCDLLPKSDLLGINKNKNSKSPGKTKARRTIKYITKNISPKSSSNVRKITTIRTRVPKYKEENSSNEKRQNELTNEYFVDPGEGAAHVNANQTSHLRSKFTCSSEGLQSGVDSPEYFKNSEVYNKRSDSENFESKKIHLQPRGDCSREGEVFDVETNFKNKRKVKISKFTMNKGYELFLVLLKVRDEAERAVKMVHDFHGLITADEERKQVLLRYVEEHGKIYPDYKRKIF